MKFGSIGRSLVRWLRPPATSVPPQITEDAIIDRMVERGLIEPAWVRPEPIPPGTPYVDPRQRGAEPEPLSPFIVRPYVDPDVMKTSAGPGIEPPGNDMPWPLWRKLETELASPPGWSACRFPTWRPGERADQGAEDSGICAFVFGIVRADFGIWLSPFSVCVVDEDFMLKDQREDMLAAVTHLPTGLGMGIFADRDSAIASCTAAEGLGIDWRTLNPNDKSNWAASFSRVRQARLFAGITICPTRHAHVGAATGPVLQIWEQRAEAMAAGRPEKLS